MITRRTNRRNYIGEAARICVDRYRANGGCLNENQLIGEAYMIMFINYYCDTFVFDALQKLKKSKLYRFKVKKLTNDAINWINSHSKEFSTCIGSMENTIEFGNICMNLEDAFSREMDSLKRVVLEKHDGDELAEVKADIVISLMLCEFAVVNMNDRIQESILINPIIANMSWTTHDPLRHLMSQLYEEVRCIPLQKDIQVYNKWIAFQKKWLSPDYVANHMYNEEESTATEIELSNILKN